MSHYILCQRIMIFNFLATVAKLERWQDFITVSFSKSNPQNMTNYKKTYCTMNFHLDSRWEDSGGRNQFTIILWGRVIPLTILSRFATLFSPPPSPSKPRISSVGSSLESGSLEIITGDNSPGDSLIHVRVPSLGGIYCISWPSWGQKIKCEM